MTQIAKVIDVTRSFLPIDPNSLTDNRMFSAQEDAPEKDVPIIAYDGYNFMPTNYGYKSFFGEASVLDLAKLTSRIDKVLIFQLSNFRSVLIALCEDGIWASTNASAPRATWMQYATYPVPAVGTHYEWTWTLLENTLYMYRQNSQEVWQLGYNDWYMAVPAMVPLNLPISFLSFMPSPTTIVTGNGTVATPYNIVDTGNANRITFYSPLPTPITLNLTIKVVGATNKATATSAVRNTGTVTSTTTYTVGINTVRIVLQPNERYEVISYNGAPGYSVTISGTVINSLGSDIAAAQVGDSLATWAWKAADPTVPVGLGTAASPMSWTSTGPTTEVDIVTNSLAPALYAFITAISTTGVITVEEYDNFNGRSVNITNNVISPFSSTIIPITPGNELWITSAGTGIAVTSLIFRTVPTL